MLENEVCVAFLEQPKLADKKTHQDVFELKSHKIWCLVFKILRLIYGENPNFGKNFRHIDLRLAQKGLLPPPQRQNKL